MRRLLAGIGLAGVLAAACASTVPTVPSVDPSAAASSETGVVPLDVAPGAGLGRGPQGGCGSVGFSDLLLHGDPARTPPVWVVDVDGGMAHPIRWPPGFSARFEPDLVVYDARNRAVAHNGDVLRNGSGYPQSDRHPMTLLSFNGIDYPCE
jgi:hypothetical protein